ncbi:hypothetical protein C8P64_2032 [Christiangramia gaetbulicola]|uniref:DUF2541 family protein n=1 Tax=Christiangramia gaetbulicola TaxID=703340 RepID=A0A2T6AI63_9FLAO|nr:DUF2541 domain-containing protein [Christiangramia gaetbulicola]PTX43504.1 hypothetical protein C8P64_2032 [Christiangramia gaetbulicola]
MKYLLLFIFLFSVSGFSQNDSWKKVGEKLVAFKNDKDNVQLTGNERNIDKVKIKCVQGTVQLKSVTIVMDDGEEKEYDARGVGILTKGMSSTNFAVPNKDEKVKRIELEYDSKGAMVINKRAKVEIWGKKDKDD